jgi:hypothetical protein
MPGAIRTTVTATPITDSVISVDITTATGDTAVVARVPFGANARTISTATLEGVGADLIVGGAGSSGWNAGLAIWLNPTVGAGRTATVTLSGADNINMTVSACTGTGAVTDSGYIANAGGNTSRDTLTAEVDGLILGVCHKQVNTAITPSNLTEDIAQAASQAGGRMAFGYLVPDATSETVGWDASMPNTFAAAYVSFGAAAPAGPTIDTQPQADTGLINGDPTRRTTVYTLAASGDTISAVTWSEDGTPISDGGIYDVATVGVGTNSASSTLTITRTVKTGTPFDIKANVVDANGNTDTNTVADTWYTGPTLSASSGTTDEDGESAITIESDYPNADGEFTVVTATAGAVVKQVSLHFETP